MENLLLGGFFVFLFKQLFGNGFVMVCIYICSTKKLFTNVRFSSWAIG